MPIVYKITNIINNKSYIGYSVRDDLSLRLYEHFAPSTYRSINTKFANAVKKYGKDSFVAEIVYQADSIEDCLQKEKDYIAVLGDYNSHIGGNVPPSQKGRKWNHTEETKAKLRKPKSVPRSKEHTEKQAATLRGRASPLKGRSTGLHSFWKGTRISPNMATWRITTEKGTEIVENLILWCETKGLKANTVKSRYYNNKLPYNGVLNIEKLVNTDEPTPFQKAYALK